MKVSITTAIDVTIRIRSFPVQTILGTQLGLGIERHYKTPGDLQVSEAVLSRMTQSWTRDGQIAVKKNQNFFLNIFKRYCASAFKVRKCNHTSIRNYYSHNFFPFVKIG